MKYLVIVARRGLVHRHECNSVEAAATAARIYRQWGWAVTVLPELRAVR